jgi:glycerophosphoryl diester phosphodiesterase
MNVWRRKQGKQLSMILGHRGAMGLAPENTLISLETALQYDVDLLEIDVHLSKDKKLMVIHDETVDRTTDGSGFVQDLTAKEIRQLDAGKRFHKKFAGQKVPFLSEVLDLVADSPARLNIEIKNGPIIYKDIEKKVSTLMEEYDLTDRIIISSFDHHVLERIKKINPAIHTAILYGSNIMNFQTYVKDLGVSAVHPHHHWVNEELIRDMHEMDIAVNTWVINSFRQFQNFSKMGVDCIGTNYPDKMKGRN